MAYYKQKLGLMPEHYYPTDAEWINQQLGYLNKSERAKICKAYSEVFREAEDEEPVSYKKSNAGRFAANSRLRIFIKKRFAVFNRSQ